MIFMSAVADIATDATQAFKSTLHTEHRKIS